MTAYYNEIDPNAAQWLRNLIDAGHIAKGDVDTRSIHDVRPDDLRGYTQCHFFAGIGGWSLALRLAGWPDDKPVWTGSCPCQSFSTAGRQKGKADERHLWPVWFSLIKEYHPTALFGEQVANAITHGWLDDVYEGLESQGYAVGSAVLPACSVGAPHKRDRLWFVGYPEHDGRNATALAGSNDEAIQHHAQGQNSASQFEGTGNSEHVADFPEQGLSDGREQTLERPESKPESERCSSSSSHFTVGIEWLNCPDGKARPVKSGLPLLAYGVSGRVATMLSNGEAHWYNRTTALKGLGNAIVPQVAAEFIKASMR
jgi:DNA (cytosine-5)-methyltransferase 1